VVSRLLSCLFFASACLLSREASAHAVGLSRGDYEVSGRVVKALYVFSGAELTTAGLGVADALVEHGVVDATIVRADGSRCAPRLDSVEVGAGDAVQIRATFSCDSAAHELAIDCRFVDALPAGHRHIATVFVGDREQSFILVHDRPMIELDVGAVARPKTTFGAMLWTGVRHIWTGYDHLAFLLGLLLLGGRARSLVGVVSAFTVAHSITLGLAVLHFVSPHPSIVEPGIALSIAYVGFENLYAPDPAKRWRIAFPFGLLHGLGFASALTELDLPRERIAGALLSFNLGVELGQLAVLAGVLPVILWARRYPTFRTSGVRILSAALSVAGCAWFVSRVIALT
jgi:hydrogenase/urease accessory protein HupE